MTSVQRIRINHSSVYAGDPQKAAKDLAALVGGKAIAFHPCEGAWVCFLNGEEDWEEALLEFYPKSVKLVSKAGELVFADNPGGVSGVGTHFNLAVPKSRRTLEKACEKLGLVHSWRDWAGFLDVWIEGDLLIECVPNG